MNAYTRRGCSDAQSSNKLPSSAEEGKADAVAAAGVVLVKKIILFTNTTPALRATPPRLRRGVRRYPMAFFIRFMIQTASRLFRI